MEPGGHRRSTWDGTHMPEFETGEVVGALLDAGANPYAAFETAVTGVNLEIIRALLDAGADPNVLVTGVAPPKHVEIVGVNEGETSVTLGYEHRISGPL